MPTPPLEEPTTKVTINIWSSDYEELKARFGHGWSAQVRMVIRDHLRIRRGVAQLINRAEKQNARPTD
jgi:hypothetical protein